jgi:hypothetical protein
MLNEALLVAHRHSELQKKQAEYIANLQQLPMDELKEVVRTGEVKLAYIGEPAPSGGERPMNWVENFKGTPFFEQAIGLEQEELQAQMAQQQSQAVSSQKSQQEYAQMDQIRLKKRLLELQKARNEAQVLSGGGGPPNQTGSGAGPGAEAQGAGALGPVAPEGQQEGSGDTNKLGSVKKVAAPQLLLHAIYRGDVGEAKKGRQAILDMSKKNPSNEALRGDVSSHDEYIKTHSAKTKKASFDGADAWGRALARADMAKVARAQEILNTGDVLGRALAKTGGVLGEVGKWALEHPGQAGAAAGGVAGAAHGLLREGGGVGSAVGEGLAGAGAGHAIGSIAGGMRSIDRVATAPGPNQLEGTRAADLKDKLIGSAKMYGGHMKNEAMRLSDKLKSSVKEAPPAEASLAGKQVQSAA